MDFQNKSKVHTNNKTMSTRTDLLFEQTDKITEFAGENSLLITKEKEHTYCNIHYPRLDTVTDTEKAEKNIIKALKVLVPVVPENILVAGLGNRFVTPDSLGVLAVEKILATRSIKNENLNNPFKNLKAISTLVPSVSGKTGIESYEMITAVAKKINPDLIIVVDALAALKDENLFSVVQITDCGIKPGSGVNGRHKEISKNTCNIPVIAIGIPTVTETPSGAIVTPKEVDLLISLNAGLLSRALNRFLHPMLDYRTIAKISDIS